MRIYIGGTFNQFHKKHKQFINTAIRRAGEDGFVFIGLFSDELVSKKPCVNRFEKRRKVLLDFLKTQNHLPSILIEAITTVEGPTLDMDFDEIIVSQETKDVAIKINNKRIKKGLKEMNIVVIPLVLAEDDQKISSSRILNGEIDEEGKI